MIELNEDQVAIRDGVTAVCRRFEDDYWLACDRDERFPIEFHRAMATDGWLGVTMPEEYGGAGLGVDRGGRRHAHGGSAWGTDCGLIDPHQHVRAASGRGARHARAEGAVAAAAGARRGPGLLRRDRARCRPGYDEHQDLREESRRRLPRFGPEDVDEHGAGGQQDPAADAHDAEGGRCKKPTDGITLFYTDLDRTKVEVRRIPKHGRNAVDSNAVFIDDLFVPDEHRIGEEGKGFRYLLDGLNPERILVAVGGDRHRRGCAAARDAVRHAIAWSSTARSARTRASSIRWPSAGSNLQAAHLMVAHAASLVRRGQGPAAPRPTAPSCSARAPATRPRCRP